MPLRSRVGVAPKTDRPPELECRRLSPEWAEPLGRLLVALREAGDEGQFHPHPLDPETADRLARDSGADLHYVVTEGREVLAYGMLRGFAEYDVPSLGIAVHPDRRGQGIGRMLIAFLHAAAREQGAERVRIKVYPDNLAAVQMYKRLGYEFEGEEDGQLVGLLRL